MSAYDHRIAAQQQLTQKQVITQKLIQSISLMAMPLAELRETIREEVEKNPALEVVGEVREIDVPDFSEPQGLDDSFPEGSIIQSMTKNDSDRKQRFLEGAVSRDVSLHEFLIEQLHITDASTEIMAPAEKIIWNLDENGFHIEPPDILLKKAETPFLEEALNVVRSLDPPGCACRDWRESLLIQGRLRGDAPEQFERFVLKGLELLMTQPFEAVRLKLEISRNAWENLEQYIRQLRPFPGRIFSSSQAQYIIPDLEVKKDEGEYILTLNDEILPVLCVNSDLEGLKEDKDLDRKTKRFLSDHLREARYFINSLSQRENTLLKAARAIVEFQREFFHGGPRFLKPLTLKDVAAEIGVHEATVSRITMNKYIQTEWGLFSLKYFFTNAVSGSGTSRSRISRVATKEIMREILDQTPKGTKISDQKMTNLLAKRGISLARRTVTKYRKELDFPSSYRQ